MRRALDSENLPDLPLAAVGARPLDDVNAFVGRGRLWIMAQCVRQYALRAFDWFDLFRAWTDPRFVVFFTIPHGLARGHAYSISLNRHRLCWV